ncbi:hypothetical protein CA54_27470 [Symmachiella macrocystis]|uniref:Uncharacterized protein n=1 Tax=Symmachiella macrocystis TaxID=2527985 RepID=A0A5C6BPE8_9PLAN|nr:DUF6655 family protein [Symmachiella macrocystis]TWU13905.1 hypothetical protein CA54_27470 [Symmachiella macrocystis]
MRIPNATIRLNLLFAAVSLLLCGCGTTISRNATEQLLASDAVDRSVRDIDFRDLRGQNVFFDTTYIKNVASVGFVNSDYIISSLRQQMMAADCRLRETREQADFVIEARVGALGADRHEIVWGIPANNLLGTVASAVPNAPSAAPPTIPEIAFAKKGDELAVAKIGVFAYHRETGQPIWQSGTNQSKSTARSTTVFGIGPFQSGTIHKGTEFAGSKIALPLLGEEVEETDSPVIPFEDEAHFASAKSTMVVADSETPDPQSEVKQVAGESPKPPPTAIPPAEKTEPAPPELLKTMPIKSEPATNAVPPVEKPSAKSTRPTNNTLLNKTKINGWSSRKPAP